MPDDTCADLALRLAAYADVTSREGRRAVGPPSADVVAQAQDCLAALAGAGLVPYHVLLGADATIGLCCRAGERHAEVECCGPARGLVVELQCEGRVPHYHAYRGEAAVDRAVVAVARYLRREPGDAGVG